jgi:histone-binding protein RBBP4
MQPSVPDLVLTGHTKDAEFALAAARTAPLVASGGKDKSVLVWDLADHASSISNRSSALNRTEAEHLKARITLTGHQATVEGVVFCPDDHTKLASVGDDSVLLLWDTNAPSRGPVSSVQNAHKQGIDVHDVSWNALQKELLVTCGQDGSVRVWDTRKLNSGGGPLYDFNHHTAETLRVEWSPTVRGVFASAGQDNLLCIWDIAKNNNITDGGGKEHKKAAKKSKLSCAPKELIFQHAGHKTSILDFQWNPYDPWTIASVSDAPTKSGNAFYGTLQMWRISDMIYRPEEEILKDMEANKEYILTGDVSKLREGGGGGGVQREQKQR